MKKIVIFIVIICIGAIFFNIMSNSSCDFDGQGNQFTMYLSSEPTNLDPAKGVDVNEGTVQSKIFDGLVKYDGEMKLIPSLAESYSVNDEGTIYSFTLKRDVKFHNGEKLTTKDVLFSLGRICAATTASPRQWVLEKVKGFEDVKEDFKVAGIQAIDDYKLTIELKEPFAPFLSLLTMPACYILPSQAVKEDEKGEFFEKPIGTGPFSVTERVRDSHIRLAANPEYHAEKSQLDEMIVRIIPETMKAEMEFESGNLDLLQLYPTNYDRFKAEPKLAEKIVDIPALNTFYVGFNNQAAPFNDVRIRKALNMLIDREALIKAIYNGRAVAAKGSIPPNISGYSENTKGYQLDLAKAKTLLNEAGYALGQDDKTNSGLKTLEFDLYHRAVQSAFEICRFIQGELEKHGVKANLKSMEWSALKDAINKGEAPAFYMSWYGDYPDGENFLYPIYHSKNFGAGGNRAQFSNPKIDHLLDEAIKIQDETQRNEAYAKINQLVVDQAPWLYLWHCSESYITSPRVKNIHFTPIFFMDNGVSIAVNQ